MLSLYVLMCVVPQALMPGLFQVEIPSRSTLKLGELYPGKTALIKSTGVMWECDSRHDVY